MPRYACPICGDPNGFPLWVDKDPPDFCPRDPDAKTMCTFQRMRAEQQAMFRKKCPDLYDENGNCKPGKFVEVLERSLKSGDMLWV